MDGTVQQLAANRIALSMYEPVVSEGFPKKIIDQVQRHRKTDEAIENSDGYTKDSKWRRSRKITTKGYYFLNKFRYGSESWIPLADLKKNKPLEIAEYAISNKLEKEPVFAWWVPHMIKKQNKIVSTVASRMWIKNTKYGMRIPTSITEAYEIDKENGNTLWRDAIKREMGNMSVAFEVLEDGKRPSAAHKASSVGVFDIPIRLLYCLVCIPVSLKLI